MNRFQTELAQALTLHAAESLTTEALPGGQLIGDSFRRLAGLLKVEEKNGIIRVSGVPNDALQRDISKLWSTSKINSHMFVQYGRSGFSFHSFFAVDVHYMLTSLLRDKTQRNWTNRQVLHLIIQHLESDTWLARTRTPQPPVLNFQKLNRLRRKAKPHQLQFLETYQDLSTRYGLNGYILSAAPGAGKTFTNLMLGCTLGADHHVIISPKNAVYEVWKREVLDWVQGSTVWVESEGRPYAGEEYLVCHYEALPAMIEASKQLRGRILVTLDESHHLNELTSQRTQLFVQLCQQLRPISVIWSSGTPLKALGYEVIPILRTIDPLFTPAAEERFRAIFGRNATRGLDILKNRIGLLSFKVTKDQFMDKKPLSDTVKVPIKNGHLYTTEAVKAQMRAFIETRMEFYLKDMREHQAFYDSCVRQVGASLRTERERQEHALYVRYIAEIRKNFDPSTMSNMSSFCKLYEERVIIPRLPDKQTRDRFRNVRSVVKYLHLKVMGEALGSCLGRARLNCHLEMADAIDFRAAIESSASKTVIFSSYVQVVDRVTQRLKGMGYEPIVVYGKTNRDLDLLLERFKTDPLANPVVATYKSLSTAVPLVTASTTLFIDQPFRDYIKYQAQSRTDRMGQLEQVRFFDYLLDTGDAPNISTRSNDILEWSKAQVESIMGKEGSAIEIETVDKYYEGFESLSAPLVRFEAILSEMME